MNIADTKEMLEDFPVELTPMIWGIHGTGKTEVVRQLSRDVWNLRCVELQGSQLSDQGDLVGLQRIMKVTVIEKVKNENGEFVDIPVEHEETVWIPPYWYPKDGKPVCLFLDELNRAQPDIKRAMMQIGNDHKILNMALPEGSRVICASNPANGEGDYEVEEWDDAENDRFFHMDFTPSAQEWIEHETAIGGLKVIIDYIANNEDDLDPYSLKRGRKNENSSGTIGVAKTSRRSWTRFDKVVKTKLENRGKDYFSGAHGMAQLQVLAQGYLGEDIARKFCAYYRQHGLGVTPREILTEPWKNHEKSIKKMSEGNIIEVVNMGKGMCGELHAMEQKGELVNGGKVTDLGKLAAENWFNFLKAIPVEAAAQIDSAAIHNKTQKVKPAWIGLISKINPKVRDFYLELADQDI